MRKVILFASALLLLPAMAFAQIQDSVFRDYDAFDRFVESKAKSRDIVTLLNTLGGRDEITKEQIQGIERQFLSLYPTDFEHSVVFNQKDLGNGISQEGRAYWTGISYVYYYFMLHQRDDALVVMRFSFNSSASKIMKEF